GKMEDVAHEGRTVLFVSHNMSAVKSLCTRGILLESGRVVRSGPVLDVVEEYLRSHATAEKECTWGEASAPGNARARLRAVRVKSVADGQNEFGITRPLVFEVEYEVLEAGAVLNLSLSVHGQDEVHLFASTNLTDSRYYAQPHPVGLYRSRCVI